jgi:sugar lactone lactonase YvrE
MPFRLSVFLVWLPAAAACAVDPAAAPAVRTIAEVPGGTGGLEVGPDGALYASEFGDTLRDGPLGTRVFRLDPDGRVAVFADGFRGASGNAFDAAGNFLQSNIGAHTVVLIAPDGERRELEVEGLANPVGIVQGPDEAYYVASCGNDSIRRVTANGASSEFSADALLACPNGIVRAGDGHLYVSNFRNGDVLRVRPDGTAERLATLPGGNNGHLIFGNGVLYVAARGAHQLYEVALGGEVRLLAGSGARGHDDGPAGEATLSLPNDLALARDGRTLYFNEVVPLDDPSGQQLAPTLVRALSLR